MTTLDDQVATREIADDRRTLRLCAMAVDAHGTEETNLASLWPELARAECCIVDEFFSEQRCYLVLTARTEQAAHPIAGRRLEILQAVLSGLPQTNVAIDLALAPSTVALNSKLGLETLGVLGKPSRVHPLLMLAAVAASQPSATTFRTSSFAFAERCYRVVGAARPDRHLASILPNAELAVIRRLIEGSSYAEIAAERGTSTRTIANQITAVFRRLRVSGRNELLHRLLVGEGLIRPLHRPAEAPPPAPAAAGTTRGEHWEQARRSA